MKFQYNKKNMTAKMNFTEENLKSFSVKEANYFFQYEKIMAQVNLLNHYYKLTLQYCDE